MTLSSADTKKGRLQRACLDLLVEHDHNGELPTSARFVFYELEHRGIVSKERRKRGRRADQDTAEALMVLRREGIVPWDCIVDETRSLAVYRYAASARDFLRDTIAEARIDCWAGQAPPLIITESRSLAGVLRNTAAKYLCPIASTNGQAGGFLHTDVIPHLVGQGARRVLYFGDYDLSGGHIEANTHNVLIAEVGAIGWERVCITADQNAEHDLQPILKTDKRYTRRTLLEAWETEALGQSFVVEALKTRLDELLPEPLADVQVREQRQRAEMAEVLA